MADTQDFFDERQGAAVIKHGILRRYLPLFTGKSGSTSAGGRVVYLDVGASATGIPNVIFQGEGRWNMD